MDYEEAADFISYNSSFYYGNHYPVIYYESYEDEFYESIEEKPLEFTKIEDLPNK